jgi:spore germination protein KA
MTLIRRRIKNTRLKFETMTIGKTSKTDICLCYLKDTVSEEILKEIKKRIKSVNLKTVLAAGYLSPYLEESGSISLFSTIGISERPDTICGKISEGRVAILIDGTPNALIIPYLFVEYFQNLDDYAFRPYFATLTRWLKYISFLLAVLLPGIYVAMGTFSPELFPSELIIKIAKSASATPLSLMFETLVIHLIYEVMREAGLRLPSVLGHAVSIVGALVIGETAVSSGLVSGPTLMIVALTALTSYVIPNLYEPIAILRLAFIIIGGTMGIWGIMLFFSAVITDICSKSNFGIPFSSPISPFNFFGMRDVLIRAGWKTLSEKTNTVQEMPGTRIHDWKQAEKRSKK